MNPAPRSIELVPGLGAVRVAEVGIAFLACWAGSLVGGVLLAKLGTVPAWFLFGLVGFNFAALIALLVTVPVMKKRARREVESGYTTLANGHPDVPRVHYPTGIVLREAGEPEPSASARRELIRRARAL